MRNHFLRTHRPGFISLFLMVLMASLMAIQVSAAPEVTRTTPIDGEILQRTPTAVGVGFDVPLDREQSTFTLLDRQGQAVERTSLSWGNNDTSITIGLPTSFPDGVYTIVWHAVSAQDGEATDGWSSFSVGNPQDANIITIPSTLAEHGGPPHWLRASARWLALTGVAACVAIWPVWRGVIRPDLGRSKAVGTTLRVQRWAGIAMGIALAGSLAELLVQARATFGTSVLDATMRLLGHTDWGFWWIVRIALLVLLGIGLAISPWWYPRRSRFKDALLWMLSLLIPVPLVLSGHSIDDEVGRISTVVISYLQVLTLSVWVGAVLALAFGASKPVVSRNVLRRFGWLTIACWATIVLTGLYLGWYFIGNRDALTDTPFGHAFIAQAGLAFAAILVAAVLIRNIGRPHPILPVLAVLGVLVLLMSARMDVLIPARTQITEQSVQTTERLSFDGRPGLLLIAPGRAGVNHLRLETPGTYLQTETQVFLDLSSPTYPQLGTKSVQMYRVQGNAFEHHGTEFSLIGDWTITVRIEEPGFPGSIATVNDTFGETNTNVSVPGPPWKFKDFGGIAGILLAMVGVLGISTAVFSTSGPLRKEAGGLAGIAIALALVVLIQGRIDPILAVESGEGAINPSDMVMVQRGKSTFDTFCASCHGTGLRGNGPLAEALNPPPTDFAQPHAKVHSNADLTYWIQYGIQGTAMPGFKSQLSEQDIRDVIAYMQHWQQQGDEATALATPEIGVCEVSPVEFAMIPEIFHHGIHAETRRGTPLVRAADSTVSPERTNEVMWTLEQMVNCANQGQFLSQIRLYTPGLLQEVFPYGASYEVTSKATSPPQPVDPANAIVIQDVQSITMLADGRIAVSVIFSDPAGIGVVPGAEPIYQVTLVLVNVDGVWMIDEVR